jgi:hypothetical protein
MTMPTDDELRALLAVLHDDYMSMVRLRDMASTLAAAYLDRGAEIARMRMNLADIEALEMQHGAVVERQAAEMARLRLEIAAEIARAALEAKP